MAKLDEIAGGAIITNKGKIITSGFKDFQYVPEAVYFKNLVKDYLKGKGKSLLDYMISIRGKTMKEIVGFGSVDAGLDTYAMILYNKEKGVVLSNGRGAGFDQRACEFAAEHGVSVAMAKEYIIAHELVHAHGFEGENSTEMALYRYFTHMAKSSEGKEKAKYEKLAKVAYARAKSSKKAA